MEERRGEDEEKNGRIINLSRGGWLASGHFPRRLREARERLIVPQKVAEETKIASHRLIPTGKLWIKE